MPRPTPLRERLNVGINPGDLRHTITLLQPVTGTDASGTNVTYQAGDNPITAYAAIEYLRGASIIKAGLDVSQNYMEVGIRYNPSFQANCRIQVENGSTWLIQAVENVRSMNAYMHLSCVAIGAND